MIEQAAGQIVQTVTITGEDVKTLRMVCNLAQQYKRPPIYQNDCGYPNFCFSEQVERVKLFCEAISDQWRKEARVAIVEPK